MGISPASIAFLFLLINSMTVSVASAQLKVTDFKQIDSLKNIQNRYSVVFVYSKVCSYCHAMKNTTFKNKQLIQLLNNKFYFLQLDAEEKEAITFNNKHYKFVPTGNKTGTHELAIQLSTANNKSAYPAICILNPQNQIIFQQSSFYSAKDFLQILEKLP